MQLGNRVHQALEADFKTGQVHGPLHWLDQVYGAEMLIHLGSADELEAEHKLARVMLEGYEEWAAETGLHEGTEVIAAERDVQVPMPGIPGVTLRGRLDQMIRRIRDGAILFRDWKTTGNISAAVNDLPLITQPRFYTMLQRLTGGDVRVQGGEYVYLLRSKRTARATGPFYHKEEIRFNNSTLNATYLRTRAVITEMLQARHGLNGSHDSREIAYPSPGNDCSWGCPFYTMCPLMDDGSAWQDMARGEFTQEDPYAYYDRKTIADAS